MIYIRTNKNLTDLNIILFWWITTNSV